MHSPPWTHAPSRPWDRRSCRRTRRRRRRPPRSGRSAGLAQVHPGAGLAFRARAAWRSCPRSDRDRDRNVIAGQRRDVEAGAGQRLEVLGSRRWRGTSVLSTYSAAIRVWHLHLADDDVAGVEQLGARREEGIGIGLVEDQVADDQDAGAHRKLTLAPDYRDSSGGHAHGSGVEGFAGGAGSLGRAAVASSSREPARSGGRQRAPAVQRRNCGRPALHSSAANTQRWRYWQLSPSAGAGVTGRRRLLAAGPRGRTQCRSRSPAPRQPARVCTDDGLSE